MSYASTVSFPPGAQLGVRRQGATDESKSVEKLYAKALSTFITVFEVDTALRKAESRFRELLEEHNSPGWDGYDARPVSADTVTRAFQFAISLPPAASDPDISANVYGDIEFEWYVRPDKLLTLSIGSNGKFHYAGLNGAERCTGTGYISGPPQRLLRDVREVLAK